VAEDKVNIDRCPSCGRGLEPGQEECPGCGANVLFFIKMKEEEEKKRKNDIDKSNFLYFIAGIIYLISFVQLYFVVTGKWEADFIWNFFGFFAAAAVLTYFGYRVRGEVGQD